VGIAVREVRVLAIPNVTRRGEFGIDPVDPGHVAFEGEVG
jgi:hypothetical protein